MVGSMLYVSFKCVNVEIFVKIPIIAHRCEYPGTRPLKSLPTRSHITWNIENTRQNITPAAVTPVLFRTNKQSFSGLPNIPKTINQLCLFKITQTLPNISHPTNKQTNPMPNIIHPPNKQTNPMLDRSHATNKQDKPHGRHNSPTQQTDKPNARQKSRNQQTDKPHGQHNSPTQQTDKPNARQKSRNQQTDKPHGQHNSSTQ